jgi:hypothetical protein
MKPLKFSMRGALIRGRVHAVVGPRAGRRHFFPGLRLICRGLSTLAGSPAEEARQLALMKARS